MNSKQEAKGKLPPRQIEIARLVSIGFGDKDIANQLVLSEGTIGWNLDQIYKKLQIHSRVALARHFLEAEFKNHGVRPPPNERQDSNARL